MEAIPKKVVDAGCQNTYMMDAIPTRLAFSGEPKKENYETKNSSNFAGAGFVRGCAGAGEQWQHRQRRRA